jgi:hypothetical protein
MVVSDWRDHVWENILVDVDIEMLADCLDDKWRERNYFSPHAVVDDALPYMRPEELMKYVKECQ